MRKYILPVLILAFFPIPTIAVMPDFLDFLNDTKSVRSRALADINLFDNDVLANPAKITKTSGLDISAFYSFRSWGVSLFNLGLIYSQPNYYAGLGILNLNAGQEEFYITHFEGAEPEIYTRQLENDNLFRIILGCRFPKTPKISLGLAANYINSTIFEDYKYTTFTYDLGLTVRIAKWLDVAFNRQNISQIRGNYTTGTVVVSTQTFPLPSATKIGIALHPGAFGIYFIYDYSNSQKQTSLGLALEYNLPYQVIYPLKEAKIRLGLKYREKETMDVGDFGLGFGIGYKNFSLDYSFVPHAYLGGNHYIGIGYRFWGKTETTAETSLPKKFKDRFLLQYSTTTKTFEEVGFNRLEDWVKVIKENKFYWIKVVATPEINEAIENFLVGSEDIPEDKIFFEVKYQEPLDTAEILIYGP